MGQTSTGNKEKGRALRGLVVLVKEELGWDSELRDSSVLCSHLLAVKLTAWWHSNIHNNYLYISPISSQYSDIHIWLPFRKLLEELGSRPPSALIMLLGTFNTKMGSSLSSVVELCGILEDSSLEIFGTPEMKGLVALV